MFHVDKAGSGGSASAISSHFGIGKGSVYAYVKRVTKALLSMKKEVV
jgi:transposase